MSDAGWLFAKELSRAVMTFGMDRDQRDPRARRISNSEGKVNKQYTTEERINFAINTASPFGEAGAVRENLAKLGFKIVEVNDPEVDPERAGFVAAHPHLDCSEDKDAWGRPKFKHSHVDAMWCGWKARAERLKASMARFYGEPKS
ncbi:hypothetical protein [Bradyrhizobium sp. SEMIA]|uniref:hypothetical protein n=1 Tax=Bradyrhizobium sp. SEMIA TaxID=2597515 RepID=UPI0018A3F10A|nr:hypothetical protein [Bradyrhizobium sp. SEMIA]QOG20434.1 hypothetical protein FOM02_26875 [Bradyrhizobium sp. SEMIA]